MLNRYTTNLTNFVFNIPYDILNKKETYTTKFSVNNIYRCQLSISPQGNNITKDIVISLTNLSEIDLLLDLSWTCNNIKYDYQNAFHKYNKDIPFDTSIKNFKKESFLDLKHDKDFFEIQCELKILSKYEPLYSDLFNIKNNDTFTDLEIICKNNIINKCHRIIFISKSDYFHKLLTSDMKEATERKIIYPDVDTHIIEMMIECFYTDNTTSNIKTSSDIIPLIDFANRINYKVFLTNVLILINNYILENDIPRDELIMILTQLYKYIDANIHVKTINNTLCDKLKL